MLNERLQTQGCNPEMKVPRSGKISSLSLRQLKHSQLATARSERARGVLGGGGDRPPPKSVWADAHDLDLDVEVSFEVVVKADLHRGERAKTH